MTDAGKFWRGYSAALIVVVCWAGFNILSRLASKSALSPFDLDALRFGVGFIVIAPWFVAVWRRSAWQKRQQFFVIALNGSLAYALLAYTGFSLAPVAHGAVLINGSIPFVTALLGWRVLKHKVQPRQLVALLIALGGIVLIALQNLSPYVDDSQQWRGDIMFFLAACCWAINGLLMRRWHLPPIDALAMMVGFSALLYLPIYALFLPHTLHHATSGVLLLQAVYQGLIVAVISGFMYNYANHSIGPHRASLMLALVPGISALLAVPVLGESLTLITVSGVMLVTLGAVLGATQKVAKG